MKRSITFAALAAGAALLVGGLIACQSEEDPVDYNPPGSGGSAGQAGSANQGGGNQGGGNQGGGNQGGGNQGGGNQGGSGGGTTVCMEAPATTVADVAKGTIKNAVKFTAVATTGPILVYTNKSKGTCMWGVFVKDPDAAYGTMVYSYGENATLDGDGGVGECPAATTSGLMDGVQPGDKLEILGTAGSYVTSSCSADGGVAPPAQVQVEIKQGDKACGMKKVGTADGAAVKATDLAGIAAGKPEFQGLLVEINDVTAENWPDGGAVGPYGIIKIAGGSGLEIHDKFYYKQLGAPKFCDGQVFKRITGVVHLDYCDWVIQPLDLTNSFDPPSPQCAQ